MNKTIQDHARTSKVGGMREKMPTTAAWIDELRDVFGSEMVDEQIRRGMKGAATFYAEEGGHSVGTKAVEPHSDKVFSGARLVFSPIRIDKAKGGKRG